MRYPISVSTLWSPLLRLFGFAGKNAYVELDERTLTFRFGSTEETVPLTAIDGVARFSWPAYYGLGAKLGPDAGVAYVSSLDGVVQVRFSAPRPMKVWGPFRTSKAECVTVSLEHPDVFIEALEAAIAR